jgi:CBS domain-containing protein
MIVRFFIDPETDEPHIYHHGVSEEEVEDVLRFPGEDRPGRGDSRAAVGQTSSGRHLRVVYVVDPEPDSVFVITAYDLKGRPLAAYRKRRRKR